MASNEVNIKVAIRIRPTNERENTRKAKQIVSYDQEKKTVNLSYGTGKKAVSKSYQFDNVFGQYSTQAEVFSTMVAPIVDEVMEGYNCTVFAYGQTGTGKTHTMEGKFEDVEERGIIPRSVHQIYDLLSSKKVDFTVKVSYLELYNEELGDLLDDAYSDVTDKKHGAPSSKKKLTLREGEKGVECKDLTEVNCQSAEQVLDCLRKGINHRQVAETQMNKASSRSHSIVTLKIMIKEATDHGEQVRFGQLNLVDLAGSECVQRSGATGERLREAGNINQSLLTLGRVITGLSEKRPGFISYRDSKLTRLLQESLGGKAKTCIVATLSPADDSSDESGSTLEYAQRARSIKNKPVTNRTSSKNNVLRETAQEVEEMRRMLQAQRDKSGTYLPTEKYEEMVKTIETSKANLEVCEEELGKLRAQLNSEKVRADGLSCDLAFSKKKCAETEEQLSSTKQCLTETKEELSETKTNLACTQAVVSEQCVTEEGLTNEAKMLDESLAESTKDISGLLAKVQRAAKDAAVKAATTSDFGDETALNTSLLRQTCNNLIEAIANTGADVKRVLDTASAKNSGLLGDMTKYCSSANSTLCEMSSNHIGSTNNTLQLLEQEASSFGSSNSLCSTAINDHSVEMESDVAASVQSSLAILKEQQAGLVALSEQVSEAALLMEKKLTEFVEQNHQALEDVKQRQSTEKEQHLAQLESLKESVESFAATHHSDSQRLEMEALQRREEAMKAHQSALEAQVEEANARAAACENEATERNAEFEKQSEELLASFTASLTAFKERQISANSEASKMTVKEIQSRAQTHSDEMNELFSEYSAKCNDAEKNGAQLMSDLTTGFETQAVKAVEKLAESSLQTCAQLDVSLDEQARAVKDTVTEVNSMNSEATSFTRQVLSQSEATCTTLVEKVELNGDNVEKKSAKLQAMVSDSETTSSNVVKAMISKSQSVVLENDSHLAQLQQHVNMNNEEVGSKMVAFESEVFNQQKDIAALVCEGGQLFETSMKLAPEHEAVLEKVESSLSTHVASINEPLEVTGNTPEKRKFDRPDEFSQTRPHEVIMKECKGKRSKMVPVLDESATTLTSRSSSKREISEVTSTSSTENDVVPSSSRKGKRRSSSGTESGDVVKNPLMEATNIVDDR